MTEALDSGRGSHSARRGRTLRLALAMRGGVSLAVWIGGAVAELDLFRRSCNEAGPAAEYEPYAGEHEQHRVRGLLYRQLLANTKYDKVEIDILAGASAGGLNAVLFALAQSCCVVMDEAVRRTWVERGSIWNLLQPPGTSRVPAILRGDDVFFPMAQDALMSLANPAAEPALPRIETTNAPDRLTVELAATLLDDPLAPNRPRHARFSFTKTPGSMSSTYTTIPTDAGDDAARTAIARLALAARTTSSFPGAFEPASIRSMDHGGFSPMTMDVNVDMASAFIYGRDANEPSEPYQVIDGGIYDNIPIDRAIQAIRRSPSTNPSERKLIYLDPEPPTPLDSGPNVERPSAASLITVVQRARALQQRTENADDELDAIRLNNDALEESRGRHAMLAAELRNLDANDGPDPSQELGNAYLRTRIAADGERFAQLLTDPWSELCRPPFRANDYKALEPEAALRVREWLPKLYVDESAIADDVYANIDRTRVLIGWIHALEDLAEGSGVRAQPIPGKTTTVAMRLGQWKQRCYRCLTVLVAAKQRTVDLVLAAPLRGADAVPYDEDVFASRLRSSRSAQTDLGISTTLLGLIDTVEPKETTAKFYGILGSARAFIGQASVDDAAWQPCLRRLGEVLEAIKSEIILESNGWLPDVGVTSEWHQKWESTIYSTFYAPHRTGMTLGEWAQLIATVGGPISTPLISFHRITGDERPADPDTFDMLLRGARAKQLEAWIRRLPAAVTRVSDGGTRTSWPEMEQALKQFSTRPLAADAKLGGNVLNRFGGFLSARWRENDWQWGRLDAAAGIARIIDSSRRDDPEVQRLDIDAIVGELQESILSESTSTSTSTSDDSNDGSPIASTAGADTLDAISPRYAYSLAARIAPLLYRALLPSSGSALSFRNIGLRLAQAPLRLFAVPLILIADPLRLAWALVIVLGSAATLGSGTSTWQWQCASSGALVAFAGIIGLRANTAARSGSTLLARLDQIEANQPGWEVGKWRDVLVRANTGRWRKWSLLLAGVVLVTASYELVAVLLRRSCDRTLPVLGVTTEAFLAWVFFVLFVQHFLNQRAYRVQAVPRRRAGRKPLAFGAGVAAIIVVGVAECIARHQDAGITDGQRKRGISTLLEATGIPTWWDRGATTWIVAGVAVALLTFLSLWGWTCWWQAAACIVVAAVVAGLLQARFDHGDRFFDLLPTLVWMAAVALVHPVIAVRRSDQDYGETGRPTLIASEPGNGVGTSRRAVSGGLRRLA